MRTINIIESTTDTAILSIKSFGVFDENKILDVIGKAQEDFWNKAIENGAKEKDFDFHVEASHYARPDGYTVSIVWSIVE